MKLDLNEYVIVNASDAAISTETATGAETCARVNMGYYESMLAVISIGVNTISTNNLWVIGQAAGSTIPTATATAVSMGGDYGAWTYRYATSGTIDSGSTVYSARADGTSTVLVLTTGSGATYIVEIRAEDIVEGYPFVSVSLSTAAAFRPTAVTYFLKPRYPGDVPMKVYTT